MIVARTSFYASCNHLLALTFDIAAIASFLLFGAIGHSYHHCFTIVIISVIFLVVHYGSCIIISIVIITMIIIVLPTQVRHGLQSGSVHQLSKQSVD